MADACQQEKVEMARLEQSMLETFRTEEEGHSGNKLNVQNLQGGGEKFHKLQGPLGSNFSFWSSVLDCH